MPKPYSSNQIIKALQIKGFIYVSQKGSHVKFRKINNHTFTVIVPAGRKKIPIGTFKSILRQANLTIKDFNKKI